MYKNEYKTTIDKTTQSYVPENGVESLPPVSNEQSRKPGADKVAVKKPARMPKPQALKLVRSLKRGLIAASIIGFGSFSWLAASHVVGTTASQTASTTAQASTSSTSSTTQDTSGSFFSGTYSVGSDSSSSSSKSSSNSSNSSSGSSSTSSSSDTSSTAVSSSGVS